MEPDMTDAETNWRNAVAANGGHVSEQGTDRSGASFGGYPYDPYKGSLAAWYPDDTVAGGRRWETAPLGVRLAHGYDAISDTVAIAEGKAAESALDVTKNLGLDKGVTGLIGKVFGIPHGAVVVIAVAGAAVGAYALLVSAGILPPFAEWERGT
jgi:hypothetical protein